MQAKLLAVVLLCVLRARLHAGPLPPAAQPGSPAREGRGRSLQPSPAQAVRLRRLDAGPRAEEATRWSASFVVYEGLEAFAKESPESRAARDLKSHSRLLLGHYRVYESLFIVDGEGRVLTGTREEQLEDWARPLVQGEVSFDGVLVSPLRKSQLLGRPTQLLPRPIPPPGTSERRGRALGSLRGAPRPARAGVDARRRRHRPRSRALAARRGGAHPRPRGQGRGGRGRTHVPHPPAPSRASGGGSIVAQGTLPELGPSVFGLRNLAGPFPGRLVATVPSARAFQTLQESRRGLILTGAAAAFMIAILNFVGARELLRPILLLSEGAKRVAAGDLDIYLPVRGNDEIADLTRSFNDMAQRIREGRESLEKARDELAHVNAGLRDANRTLETLAITDGLTSLFNRRHFQDTLRARSAAPSSRRGCSRSSSSTSITSSSTTTASATPKATPPCAGWPPRSPRGSAPATWRSATVARSWPCCLPACPRTQAAEVAEKLRNAIRANTPRSGRFGGPLTVSIGVATFPDDARGASALMERADAALYAAKAKGRDRVEVSSAGAAQPETGAAGWPAQGAARR